VVVSFAWFSTNNWLLLALNASGEILLTNNDASAKVAVVFDAFVQTHGVMNGFAVYNANTLLIALVNPMLLVEYGTTGYGCWLIAWLNKSLIVRSKRTSPLTFVVVMYPRAPVPDELLKINGSALTNPNPAVRTVMPPNIAFATCVTCPYAPVPGAFSIVDTKTASSTA
jgi:hypothetical protein